MQVDIIPAVIHFSKTSAEAQRWKAGTMRIRNGFISEIFSSLHCLHRTQLECDRAFGYRQLPGRYFTGTEVDVCAYPGIEYGVGSYFDS